MGWKCHANAVELVPFLGLVFRVEILPGKLVLKIYASRALSFTFLMLFAEALLCSPFDISDAWISVKHYCSLHNN